MMAAIDDGWQASAEAWIAHIGEAGDRGRVDVLDKPMMEVVAASGANSALDVGCGEGRFCRMMAASGIQPIGIDPTPHLIATAKARDPRGHYVEACAEDLPFETGQFDLVVSYVSLIDIPDYRTAIAEMARVVAPGGMVLVANLNSFVTALPKEWPEDKSGWVRDAKPTPYYALSGYMEERAAWTAWSGIRIINHHRPLSSYMAAFLGAGLTLVRYDEPPYLGKDPAAAAKFASVPWFNLMIWQKPQEDAPQ